MTDDLTGEPSTVADVLGQFRSVVLANFPFLAAAFAAIVGLYSAFDLLLPQGPQFIPQIVVGIFGQFLVTERLLADRLPEGRGHRRYGAIFGSGLLSGLGIVVGLFLLIVPGLVLVARWSVAVPIIVAENAGATESLGRSWDRTSPSAVPVFLVYLIAMLVYAAGLAAIVAAFSADTPDGIISILSLNTVASVLSVLGWVLAVAVYRCITPGTHGLDAVFA